MMPKLLRIWTGPLPDQELFPTDRKVNPLLHWFIHPLKRRAAKYYLWILQHFFSLKVIALTGSSGKTTTSGMLYSVLSQVGNTIKTADSTTSTYNIPTTILKCTPGTKYLIIEMGVEYPGDIDFYCWLAKPDIGVVLNVSSVHASFLGSIEDIAREKNKLLKYSRIGLSQKDLPKVISSQITKSLTTLIEFQISNFKFQINLPLLGTHFSQNVSAIFKICQELHIPGSYVKSGLESVTAPNHRMNIKELQNRSLILDDSYNANPASVSQSLKTLEEVSIIKNLHPIFIFAQMNELGQYEKKAHQIIGTQIKQLGITDLYCLGPATKFTIDSAGVGKYFSTQQALLTAVQKVTKLNSAFVILVKGSHSWHLENLIQYLMIDDRK